MRERTLVSFDWAIKNILRDKANFDILEGFLCTLLKKELKILSILESEGNQQHSEDKFNRVDLAVEDEEGELIIIEIQNNREVHYLERLLYGSAKAIVDNMRLGDPFSNVKKVITINVLYFLLGEGGSDYIYYGTTEFVGLNDHSKLEFKRRERAAVLGRQPVSYNNIFPEYYLIEVERFGDEVKQGIDEWIYFFKNSEIRPEFRSKNIQKVRERLDILKMSPQERAAYERYLRNRVNEREAIETAKTDGLEEGLQKGLEEGLRKGRQEGRQEEKTAIAERMLALGVLSPEQIAEITGLSPEVVRRLLP
jgi:predicted transposase/invertase (TIGR01784 family)